MPDARTHKIRKYPNRRFYDVSQSRHITLEELYELVRGGDVIQVTDSHSGEDITSQVLTHIILERDAPKLTLFSAELLHQVIQSNQQILGSFMETYFNRALQAFMASQQQFDGFLKSAGIAPPPMLDPMQWARAFMPGGSHAHDSSADRATPAEAASPGDQRLSELAAQVEVLSRQLRDLSPATGKAESRAAGKKTKAARMKPAARRKR